MLIMGLTGCTEVIAQKAYDEKNGDVLLAVDFILFGGNPPPEKTKRKRADITEHEEHLNSMRKTMEAMDAEIEKRPNTTSNPLDCEEQDEMQALHEEMVQRNSCFQECQIPSMEEEVRTPETVCRSHPV